MSQYLIDRAPKCCDKCNYTDECQAYLNQLKRMQESNTEQIFDIFGEMRLKDCLYKELPTHGDLIDRSLIEYSYDPHFGGRLITIPSIIDKLPVVVGANHER